MKVRSPIRRYWPFVAGLKLVRKLGEKGPKGGMGGGWQKKRY